tara:strand:+ start:1793 stop:2719 length:927 start_codon:yes stop_codon:yes gene_type:complete
MICPYCKSSHTKKNGTIKPNSVSHIKNGKIKAHPKQQYQCKNCEKNFSITYEELEKTPYANNRDVEPGDVLNINSKKTLRIHGLTDVHVGAVEFDSDKFHKAVETISKDKDARWFGNGDLLELIPPNYKISQEGQDIPPDDQYLEFIRLIEPIKDKCLFIRGGNHDYIRSFNILNFDVCKVLAKEMEVPYFRMPGYTQINIKDKTYKLVSGHGKGGGKNGDLELDKMAAVYSEGDVFFLGHNHQLYVKPMHSFIVNKNNMEEERKKWYIRGGSFLKYADYARYSFYPLSRTGWVTMEFSEKGVECWEN